MRGLNKFKFSIETLKAATGDAQIIMTMDGNSFEGAEYVATSNSVTDIAGSATSSTFTIKSASFNTPSYLGFSDNDMIVASSDIYIGKFQLSTNNVRKQVVNSFDAVVDPLALS